jgi:hypothetical protein
MEPPVSRPWEEWSPSRSLATVPWYSDVSVNIAMYTLYNNIVSDIFFHSDICVDFLGTHMTSLVLFFAKSGVTNHNQVSTYISQVTGNHPTSTGLSMAKQYFRS